METRRLAPSANPAEIAPSDRPDHREESQPPAPETESVQPESQGSDPEARVSEAHKGKKLSQEHRDKIGKASKGRKHSPESKAKISRANKGKKLSQEHRDKIGKASKGRKHSPESKAKISRANKGKKLSQEHRDKIGKASKGRKHSPESKAKISKASKGRKHSPESKAKMSEAQKGDKHYHYDQSIDKIQLAIAAHVQGESMVQASRDQGFYGSWLSHWKREYPERFQMLYGQAADELDRAALEADIGAYVLGSSPEEAGLDRDQAGIRLARRALRLCYDKDLSAAEASQQLGLDPGWLDQYQQTQPSTCQKLDSEIRHSRA